jgi:predicted ATPase
MSHIENDSYFLYEEGQNLAAFLYTIREENKTVYNRIVKNIQSIAPFFSDFFLQPNAEGFVRLQWQDRYSSNVYGASDFSDGTMRFIALTTLFMQPELPQTIIIDEPELGLHPFAITKLAGMINIVANRGSQVIVATQSADLVNHFKAEQVITVDQVDGESLFKRLSADELSHWLDEYSIGDLWQRNIIQGGQPK